MAGSDETRIRGLSGDVFTCGVTRVPLRPIDTLLVPLWLSSACRPSNVELYVLNSVYLDGNGAELATSGDVGVFNFVTDGDLIVGVDDFVGVCTTFEWSMTVFVIVGELKSNDKRDL